MDEFYQVPLDSPYKLPSMTDIEKLLFDAINNAGAATRRAVINYGRNQGYSQLEVSSAIGSLKVKGLLERRTITDTL